MKKLLALAVIAIAAITFAAYSNAPSKVTTEDVISSGTWAVSRALIESHGKEKIQGCTGAKDDHTSLKDVEMTCFTESGKKVFVTMDIAYEATTDAPDLGTEEVTDKTIKLWIVEDAPNGERIKVTSTIKFMMLVGRKVYDI